MKLYVYDHCPYCVKARMIFALKHVPVELVILQDDDETTPMNLVGKKVVPILEKTDGSHMPESMDIVHYIDGASGKSVFTGQTNPAIGEWLKQVSAYARNLLMPRYPHADLVEFSTLSAREYFIKKKEAVIGSFAEHLKNTPELLNKINADLIKLEPLLQSEHACNGQLSVDDIHLFAMLRCLSIVKGINYPARVDAYRRNMSVQADIPLYDNIAR